MSRPEELVSRYLRELDKHIADVSAGRALVFFEIQDFAGILAVHPVHLSNTIRETTGKSPCAHCEERLIVVAKDLIANSGLSIARVAARLTYDPPGFSRFFKKLTGLSPSHYRRSLLGNAA